MNYLNYLSQLGAIFGLFAGLGLALLWNWYYSRRQILLYRTIPFLRPRAAIQLSSRSGLQAIVALTTTPLISAIGTIAGVFGSTNDSIKTRQRLAGLPVNVHEFRVKQLTGSGLFLLLATILLIVAANWRHISGLAAILVLLVSMLVGAIAPDHWLTWKANNRQEQLAREVPDVVELVALSIGAGEGITKSLERSAQACSGALGEELVQVSAMIRSGQPLTRALEQLGAANNCPPLSRLVDVLVNGIERGAPLAAVMREQAIDSREASRRELMESAGKKEIQMLFPVVFLIMPITVVFALYPGLLMLRFAH